MNIRSVLACLAAVPLLVGASPQPVRLQPSSPWVLDYAENSCRLSRTFGMGDDQVVLLFESDAPDDLNIVAVGKPLATNSREVPGRFLPVQGKPFMGGPAMAAGSKPAVLWSTVSLLPDLLVARLKQKADEQRKNKRLRPPPIDRTEEAAYRSARQTFASAATAMQIDGRRSQPVILETGSLGNPIKLFDQCLRDSLRAWGVDPDVEDRIVRPVWTPDATRWFSANDYPQSMWTTGKESVVSVRLLVDASGKVTKCTSLSHFDAPEFNKVVCDVFMTRARFEPAELADGTKVPSYYIRNVVFRMGL